MATITTVGAIKTFLGIAQSDATETDQLHQWHKQAEALVKSYLRAPVVTGTTTEYYEGANTPYLILRHRPVTSITNVWQDPEGYWGRNTSTGVFDATEDLLVSGEDYALDPDMPSHLGQASGTSRSGLLVRLQTPWPARFDRVRGLLAVGVQPAHGNVKVTYAYGWNPIPEDILLAVHMAVARIRLGSPYGASLVSVGYGAANASFGEVGGGILTREIKIILAPYRSLVQGSA